MNDAPLHIEGLRVEYEDVTAVDDITFTVERGMVYGLIGPNGAGKTTTIRAVANLVTPTYGQIRVLGVDMLAEPQRALGRIGLMPDFPPVYADLTVREFLALFASAHRIPKDARRNRIEALAATVGLTEKLDSFAGKLSRGMKQRLFLAKTLLHDPDLLLLDEPASGLDPRARMDLRDVIVQLGQQGKAVVVSSHILAEMADFCNSVGIMEQGRMVVSGRIEDVLKQVHPARSWRIRLLAPDDRLGALLDRSPHTRDIQVEGATARFALDGEADQAVALLTALVQAQLPVVAFFEEERKLEDIFLHVSEGRVS